MYTSANADLPTALSQRALGSTLFRADTEPDPYRNPSVLPTQMKDKRIMKVRTIRLRSCRR